MQGSLKQWFQPIKPSVFWESAPMVKLPLVLKTIKTFMEAIRRFSVVCLQHKYCRVCPHGTKQTGAFPDK